MTSTDEVAVDVRTELRQWQEQLQAMIRHADTKAQALVGVHSLAMAGAVALVKTSADASPWLTGAAVLVGVALVVTLSALLPRLGHGGTSITAWSRMSAAAVLASVADGGAPNASPSTSRGWRGSPRGRCAPSSSPSGC
ncbi:hypothetical protein [Saccharopolyspora sp. ASAGF58]|uniref:hypothetical protein n=1 Tax=Saccharopolyspora sp. ASAGF58 TaxID=2719023 RepID=UPI0014400986|nr:hypothetical protein [Saccharopolyspora sp. ASAGF58]QIZ35920.1 hypothetical protein FDZ84_16000 [Saccharopolyspora sp. ASAGF58]